MSALPTPPRPGPRPLALHLTMLTMISTSSVEGSRHLRSGSEFWRPELRDRAAALADEVERLGTERLRPALERVAKADLAETLTGLTRYRRHPRRREIPNLPILWSEGGSRLIDYGDGTGRGAPALFVPSLINRAHVFDLSPERSLLRDLARRGVRPLLLDWGDLGADEIGLDLTGYIAGRLTRAAEAAAEIAGRPTRLVGYCMGGTMAVAAAGLRPDLYETLTLLAAPWDFHAVTPWVGAFVAAVATAFGPLFERLGKVPVDALQTLFALPDPRVARNKFRRFAALDPDSPAAAAFVDLEDWLNDGVSLSVPVAMETMVGWYGRNDTGRGVWRVGEKTIDPTAIRMPTLVVSPKRDRIVPPPSALALARAIPGAEVLTPDAGHIGMTAGARVADTFRTELARRLTAGWDTPLRLV